MKIIRSIFNITDMEKKSFIGLCFLSFARGIFYIFYINYITCELKVCSTKKPWNPTVPLALPVAPELSALCVIRPPALKGGKNIFGNNA